MSITVLQGSVATRVNDGRIFSDFRIANLLLSVMVKEFRSSVRIWQSYGKNTVTLFSPDTVYIHFVFLPTVLFSIIVLITGLARCTSISYTF